MQRKADDDNRPAEFDAAVMQWLPFLKMMARKLERDTQKHEDLVSETVLEALKGWARYREDGSFTRWLVFQMRTVRERWRKIREREGVTVGLDSVELEPVNPPQEKFVLFDQAIAKLPERHRDLFLRIAAGYTFQEIADEYGVELNTIKMRVAYERSARLRPLLAGRSAKSVRPGWQLAAEAREKLRAAMGEVA